ncbi:hypothetical protein AMTRI_Chr01g114670 [Amborella trichopoda]
MDNYHLWEVEGASILNTPTTCALETMGGHFLVMQKFTGLSVQHNFPKFTTEKDCLSEISADSIKNCCLSLWISLLFGSKKIALTNFAVLRMTSVKC